MRLDQLRVSIWLGNGLLLALTALSGLQFRAVHAARSVRTPVSWPDSGRTAPDERGHALDARALGDLLDTPVNGLVPPPPPPPGGGGNEPDALDRFVASHVYVGLIHSERDLFDAIAYVRTSDGRSLALRPGERVGSFTLIGFDSEPENGSHSLVFRSPAFERLARLTSTHVTPELCYPMEGPKLVTAYTDLARPLVDRDRIDVPAFQALHQDPSGRTWYFPAEELAWWRRFGDTDVVAGLRVEPATRDDGSVYGVRLLDAPGASSPVASGRGLAQGDVVVSVDAEPTRDAAAVFAHLTRSEVRATVHFLVVESPAGEQRVVIHRLSR